MKKDISLSVVVLVFNEEASLEGVVRDLMRFLPEAVKEFEILIIDDGSRDGTAAIARRLAAECRSVRVVTHSKNLGLPCGARTGYRESRCDFVVWIEGDGQFLVGDLRGFLECIPRYKVVASYRERSRYPMMRRLVSFAYNSLLKILLGLDVRDAGSVIMVQKGLVEDSEFISSGVAINAELLLRAQSKGYEIGQCPRTFVLRVSGESRIFGVREVARAMADIWRLYRNPPGADPCSGS